MTDIALPRTEVPADIIVRRKHPGRWVGALAVVLVFIWLIKAFADAPGIHWEAVGNYLTFPAIMRGLVNTIELTILAQLGAIFVGVFVAIARLSQNRVLSVCSNAYTWFFRAVPLLVQLIFIYNLALVFPMMGIGIPFTNLWWMADTNSVITGFTAAIIGFSLADGAQMAEIIRGGILSVPHGQREAAIALGMSPARVMRTIVLPQAMRFILPPTGNNFISLLKGTALVSVIAGNDLLTNAQYISSRTFEVIEMLIVASFWYLVLVSIASLGQYYLERHFGRSAR